MAKLDVIQIAVSGALFSLIWLVQLLIYPSFKLVNQNFNTCMVHHQYRISWVVIPLMIIEVVVTLIQQKIFLIGIVICIWTSTAFIQVPIHRLLANNSKEKIDWLIQSNWVRTILWSVKLFVVLSTAIDTL